MTERTVLIVVLGCLGLIAIYLGWDEYKNYKNEARKHELLLQEREQATLLQLQKSEEEEARRLAEAERIRAEERAKEVLAQREAERLALQTQAQQTITEALKTIRGTVENFGNGIVERHDNQTVWTNQLKEASFSATSDSTFVYSYETGTVKSKRIEVLFRLENMGELKRNFVPFDFENIHKGGYEYLEVTTPFKQKDFEYCEYEEGKSLCKNRKNVGSFLIFLSGKSMVEKVREQFILIQRLHHAKSIEELKAILH